MPEMAVKTAGSRNIVIAAGYLTRGHGAAEFHDAVFGVNDERNIAPRGDIRHRFDKA